MRCCSARSILDSGWKGPIWTPLLHHRVTVWSTEAALSRRCHSHAAIAGASLSTWGGGISSIHPGFEPIPVNHSDVYGCSQSPCWPGASSGLFYRPACAQPSPSLYNSFSCPTLFTTFLKSSAFFFSPPSQPKPFLPSFSTPAHYISKTLNDEAYDEDSNNDILDILPITFCWWYEGRLPMTVMGNEHASKTDPDNIGFWKIGWVWD